MSSRLTRLMSRSAFLHEILIRDVYMHQTSWFIGIRKHPDHVLVVAFSGDLFWVLKTGPSGLGFMRFAVIRIITSLAMESSPLLTTDFREKESQASLFESMTTPESRPRLSALKRDL
ncbi:hypothetical protein Tco_1045971 [Tanacetum coccineum]